MISDKLYQSIFDEIQKCLPQKWNKLIVYLEYGNASYSFSFYIKLGNEFVKCYDILGINESLLDVVFANIDSLVAPEREKLGNDRWSNMTMVVNSNGSMHTDFDYTDLSEGVFEYKKEWKAKYLI